MSPATSIPAVLDPASLGVIKKIMPTEDGKTVEVRKWNDSYLQHIAEQAQFEAEKMGNTNGVFFDVNIRGDWKTGLSIKRGKHWSVSGFVTGEKKKVTGAQGRVALSW